MLSRRANKPTSGRWRTAAMAVAIWCVALAIFGAQSAKSDTAPVFHNAGEFARYCAGGAHAKECADHVAFVDIMAMLDSKGGRCASTMPISTAKTDAAQAALYKQVVDYIVDHTELAQVQLTDAIRTAELSIWPCAQAAPPAPQATPNAAGDFMAYCADASHDKLCTQRVADTNILTLLHGDGGKCMITMPAGANGAEYDANARAVVSYIETHSELASRTTDEAIIEAEHALWPCRS